jgi:hypothetical protein
MPKAGPVALEGLPATAGAGPRRGRPGAKRATKQNLSDTAKGPVERAALTIHRAEPNPREPDKATEWADTRCRCGPRGEGCPGNSAMGKGGNPVARNLAGRRLTSCCAVWGRGWPSVAEATNS